MEFSARLDKSQKIKPNIIVNDNSNVLKSPGHNPNKINNLITYNKVLYSKPLKNKKRSYSEYFLKPINDIFFEKTNNNERAIKKLVAFFVCLTFQMRIISVYLHFEKERIIQHG